MTRKHPKATPPPALVGVLTAEEAADFLRVKPDTLRIWRRDRRGPKHTKVGNRVRYRLQDLEAFLKANRVN